MAIGQTIGQALGAVAGTAVAGPAGTALGAALGGAAGGITEQAARGRAPQVPREDPRTAGIISETRRRRMRFERQGIPALTRPLQESLQVGLRSALRFGESGAALGLAGRLQRQTGQAVLQAGIAGQQAAERAGQQELQLEANRSQRRLELGLLQRAQTMAQRAQAEKGLSANLLAGVASNLNIGGGGGANLQGTVGFQSALQRNLGTSIGRTQARQDVFGIPPAPTIPATQPQQLPLQLTPSLSQ